MVSRYVNKPKFGLLDILQTVYKLHPMNEKPIKLNIPYNKNTKNKQF